MLTLLNFLRPGCQIRAFSKSMSQSVNGLRRRPSAPHYHTSKYNNFNGDVSRNKTKIN